MARSEDHYTRVAEQLIEKLKEGTAPWQQPWDAGGYGSRPMNPTTGKPYRGGNMLYLMMQGHGDPRWMTYRQAQSVGAQVRRERDSDYLLEVRGGANGTWRRRQARQGCGRKCGQGKGAT